MGLLDRLLGREDQSRGTGQHAWQPGRRQAQPKTDDEQAIEQSRHPVIIDTAGMLDR